MMTHYDNAALTPAPHDDDVPKARLKVAGPVFAVCSALLLFAMFVFGASRTEDASKGSQQHASEQSQQTPSTMGQAPNR